jgi:hypothetical protein
MRQIIEADETGGGDDTSGLASEPASPDDTTDLLMGEMPGLSIEDAQPEPVQIFRMWQIFLDRVNPLNKVVHVPTLQPYILEAASGSQAVPLNYQALTFAVYNCAVMAMDQNECKKVLGCSREAAHNKFGAGVRASLVQTQFMKNHDLVTLQALTLHLVSALVLSCTSGPAPGGQGLRCNANRSLVLASCPSKVVTTDTRSGSSAASVFALPRRWASTATGSC